MLQAPVYTKNHFPYVTIHEMMNSLKLMYLFIGCLLCFSSFSQNSFVQIMDQVETWENSSVADCPDQGFIVANDLARPFTDGAKHSFFMVKYDSCAQVEWSRLFESENFGLFLQDIAVGPSGEVFATGATGLQDVFLLKVDAGGEIMWLNAYHTSDYDRCYSIDIQEQEILLFGNFLDQIESRNYALVTDLEGGIRWARMYAEQAGDGGATFAADGSMICRNGNSLYELDPMGNPRWANQYSDAEIASQPIAMEGGYAVSFTAQEAQQQYVAMIGPAGVIQWQSEALPAAYELSDLAATIGGEIAFVNTYSETEGEVSTSMPMITLMSDKGQVTAQYQFELSEFGRFVDPSITVNEENGITLKGKYENEFSYDYVLRITPDTALGCVGVPLAETYETPAPLKQAPINVTAGPLNFERIDTFHIAYQDIELNPWPYCDKTKGEEFMTLDSLVACADTFLFTTEFEEAIYEWSDGSFEANRILKAPGKYKVDVITCNKTYHYDINLDLGKCPCPMFVPNAFSPNGDGINDIMELHATCLFRDFDLKIFNRWGEMMYHVAGPEVSWDGTTVNGQKLPSGVYVYAIDYSWEIYPGFLRKEQATGTISLMR